MNLVFLVFFIILTILHIFSTLWAENAQTYSWWQLDMNFVPYDLSKNISIKTTLGEVLHPGPWANIFMRMYDKLFSKVLVLQLTLHMQFGENLCNPQ